MSDGGLRFSPSPVRRRKRGFIILAFAVGAFMLCGFAGLSLDVTYLQMWKRKAQTAADAAAQAAAFRVNGEAVISRDPTLLEQFAVDGKLPRTVLVVTVKEAYVHCAKALVRSDVWNPAKHAVRGTVPSFGTMMAAHTCGFVDGPALDEELKTRIPATLY